MTKVAATEFARNFGRYREEAQHEAVAVVTHNRVTGYFVSARDYDEYQRLKATAASALAVDELADVGRVGAAARVEDLTAEDVENGGHGRAARCKAARPPTPAMPKP